ncbi:TlpA disulfide reductase family protein [Oceanispirochaeta sp.]|uniref:TlpA family protein disulfide reductase n=1 Tax=Oceanispirochaeta sp. TaxID=2035350 RepID=UPI0026172BA8|nr:TlpA disulfide reductase family protein [Oceanispirochaeta sp.]MDA3956856.1 TlpA disulfide reductase family protein [Oceanispirochaeta sp.]
MIYRFKLSILVINMEYPDFTILNFWATWCPPCRAEIPEIIRYTRDYKDVEDTRIRLIGINMTSTEASISQVLDFIKAQDINFPVLLDKNGEAAGRFGIKSVPTTIVFDSQGELLETRMGAVDYSWLAKISPKK